MCLERLTRNVGLIFFLEVKSQNSQKSFLGDRRRQEVSIDFIWQFAFGNSCILASITARNEKSTTSRKTSSSSVKLQLRTCRSIWIWKSDRIPWLCLEILLGLVIYQPPNCPNFEFCVLGGPLHAQILDLPWQCSEAEVGCAPPQATKARIFCHKMAHLVSTAYER